MATLGYNGAFNSAAATGAGNDQRGNGPYTMTEYGTVTALNVYAGGAAATSGFLCLWDSATGNLLASVAASIPFANAGPNNQAWITGAVSVAVANAQGLVIGLWSAGAIRYSIQTVTSVPLLSKAGSGSGPASMSGASSSSAIQMGAYLTYTPGQPSGVKIWSGSAFVKHPAKTYSGSVWNKHPVKTWNGTAWQIH